jgi:hypothetical protein
VVNPRREPATVSFGDLSDAQALLAHGIAIADGVVAADGFGYGVFTLAGR